MFRKKGAFFIKCAYISLFPSNQAYKSGQSIKESRLILNYTWPTKNRILMKIKCPLLICLTPKFINSNENLKRNMKKKWRDKS